jgi:hypothetical protein
MQREAASLPEQVETNRERSRHKSDFASYTWQLQGGRSISVGPSRIAHERPASSTASVEADKDEICSPACVKLKLVRLTPQSGGK